MNIWRFLSSREIHLGVSECKNRKKAYTFPSLIFFLVKASYMFIRIAKDFEFVAVSSMYTR